MEMLNSQKKDILSSSPLLFEMAGLAYLDLCILCIHFFECQKHKRNKCCINININILLLKPAHAAKAHGASARSIYQPTSLLIWELRFKSKVYTALCIAFWLIPPEMTLFQQCPEPIPGVGGTHAIAAYDLEKPICVQVGSWAAWQQCDQHLSNSALWSCHLAQLEGCQKAREGGRVRHAFGQFLNLLSMESIPHQANSSWKNRKQTFTLSSEKLSLLLLLNLRLKHSDSITAKQAARHCNLSFWSGFPLFFKLSNLLS